MLGSAYYNWAKRDSDEMAGGLHPDITLIVGHVENAVKFFAHKLVLSNHSGYFKTLLSSYKGYEVHVSNINSHTFAYLLTFMYTGQLDLNPLNVYEIFLASNLLHITDALNLCRQYLADIQHSCGKSIVKPIPRKRAAPPDAVDTVHTLKYQPLRINNDRGEVSSIFKPVGVTVTETATATAIAKPECTDDSKADGTSSKAQRENGNFKKPETSTNVILDVACCDGPIKFRKIVNKYYDPNKANNTRTSDNDRAKSEISIACQGCKQVFKNYHKFKKYVTSASVLNNNKLPDNRSVAAAAAVRVKCKKKNDTNLQCFACKTCGSKFPSYYFVQKHRKIHHHSETGESLE